MSNVYFSQANLTSAYLGGALCYGTYFRGADLKFANLKTAEFIDKTIIDLKWYSVWEIVNHGAVKKNLSGADLSNANLQGVNFEEANLTNAKLNHAILSHSNLNRANLTNTELVGANICGVDLNQANLKGAKLKSVISDRRTQLADAASAKTSLMVKERPTAIEAVAATSATTTISSNQSNLTKSSKNKNNNLIIGILLLGIIASIAAIGHIFFNQNLNYPWPEKLQLRQETLK